MKADKGLTGGTGYALNLIEALLQRCFARLGNIVIMLRAVENAADFLVDEALGVLQLRPHIGDEGVARAVLARKVGFVLCDVSILRSQLGDHLRGDGGVDAARVATGFGKPLHLIVFRARLGGLRAGSDQFVVEIRDLLIVHRDALRHGEIVGCAEILDRLLRRDDARFQSFDLAIEPARRNLGRVVFGANLFLEVAFGDRVGDGGGLSWLLRTDADIHEEGGALPGHLHPSLQNLDGSCLRGILWACPGGRAAAAEQSPDRVEQARLRPEFGIGRQLKLVHHALQDRDRLNQQRLALDGGVVGAEIRQDRLAGIHHVGAARVHENGGCCRI